MNYAGNIEIIRKHTFMITKKICVLLCFQSFLYAKHFFNKGYFYSRSFQKYSRTSAENFKDIAQFFSFQGLFNDMMLFQGLFKARANHGTPRKA